ncbi:MAG: hypothetical protein K2X03_02440 [Bryobacteraceae bacterium]|nr:hypothetical protein [Bryobacteraceae bacterium]
MVGAKGQVALGEGERALSPWILSLIWIATAIAVWWCWYATWVEMIRVDTAGGSSPQRRVEMPVSGFDPVVSRWLPAIAATTSCGIALWELVIGGNCARFLLTTLVLVGLKGTALGIQALLRD